MFDFRLDLPLHRQSAAARFGVLGIVLGTAVPVRDCGTFAAQLGLIEGERERGRERVCFALLALPALLALLAMLALLALLKK